MPTSNDPLVVDVVRRVHVDVQRELAALYDRVAKAIDRAEQHDGVGFVITTVRDLETLEAAAVALSACVPDDTQPLN